MRVTSLANAGHRSLRYGRRSIAGQAYLVTTVTSGRRRVFRDWPVAAAVARELQASRLWRDHCLHAWVLMPDHLHVLVTLGKSESLERLVSRVKAVSAGTAHCAMRCSGAVWPRAFHDHAVRRDENLRAAALYVIANPVRAGLVDTVWSWPFWNTEWTLGIGDLAFDAHR